TRMASKQNVPAPDPNESLPFEQALERLETIVEELERGALSLDESIVRYEEGVKLSRQLGRTLDEAEKRIERLVVADNGSVTTEPMALDEVEAGPEPAGRREAPTEPAG